MNRLQEYRYKCEAIQFFGGTGPAQVLRRAADYLRDSGDDLLGADFGPQNDGTWYISIFVTPFEEDEE